MILVELLRESGASSQLILAFPKAIVLVTVREACPESRTSVYYALRCEALPRSSCLCEAPACATRAFYCSTCRRGTRLLSCQSTYYRAQKVQTTLLTIASLGIFLRVASCEASPRFYRRPGFYEGDLTVKMEPNRAHQADLSMCFAVMCKQNAVSVLLTIR